jgi:ribosome-associated translation inhibitor RaiA
MNIAVQAEGLTFTPQIRAYVEYRMFSAISRFGGRCVSLSVSLEESGSQYRCAAILYLTPSGRVRVSAAADRPYAAVDQSPERLSHAVARRLKQGGSGPGSRRGRPSSRGLTSRGRSRKKNSS